MRKLGTALWFAFTCSFLISAQATLPEGTPAEMIVTMGHYYGAEPPLLLRDDVEVTQGYKPRPITALVPLRGERGRLELFVLVDSCSSCEVGSKFEELHQFIRSQSPATAIGVAYIQEGQLHVALKPSQDRERAIRALNAPAGSKPSNPFGALTDLIKGWNQDSTRHAILMISNGIDPKAVEGADDPSAEAAIEAAQRAGVTVYAIYHPSADYATADYATLYSGQVQLAHVANETGGEAYFLGFGPLPSLAPFLADISDHLANQYLLQFVAQPGETNSLQEVTVKSKISNLDLMAPDKAWIPASAQPNQNSQPTPGER